MSINEHLPPLPWSKSERTAMSFLLDILDADGNRVATVWGSGRRRDAVAELIIEASNVVAANRRLG
jgi:hypothetical protein